MPSTAASSYKLSLYTNKTLHRYVSRGFFSFYIRECLIFSMCVLKISLRSPASAVIFMRIAEVCVFYKTSAPTHSIVEVDFSLFYNAILDTSSERQVEIVYMWF